MFTRKKCRGESGSGGIKNDRGDVMKTQDESAKCLAGGALEQAVRWRCGGGGGRVALNAMLAGTSCQGAVFLDHS